jgi:hypothetical protein
VLGQLMREGKLYRDERLSVSSLALKLKLPEHRLRRLINHQLGHRNFNAFERRGLVRQNATIGLGWSAQLITVRVECFLGISRATYSHRFRTLLS